jgi:hypothetical protein
MNLCYYNNIFGIPKEGLHKYRLFNIAIVDIILTILVALIITYFFNLNFINILLILFIIGIILHKLFCVNTTINNLIFNY